VAALSRDIDANCDALVEILRQGNDARQGAGLAGKDDGTITELVVALARCALRDLNRLVDAAEVIARKLGQ
jgi:hypothetical protein